MIDSVELENFLLDDFALEHARHDFEFLANSTFIAFFRSNLIDIPRCFKITKSMRRPKNEIMLLKLNNYLMRGGKRHKTLNLLNLILSQHRTRIVGLESTKVLTDFDWKTVFISLNYMCFSGEGYYEFPFIKHEPLSYDHQFHFPTKDINEDWSLKKWLLISLKKMLPIFSFYIYRVDKKIFKNTRGKSGKFTFIWKYVASYKRLFLVMHWLMKELRVTPGRTIYDRLSQVIKTILTSPESTWMWRVKKFSHNYVYYNCRRTLAENYRTTKK